MSDLDKAVEDLTWLSNRLSGILSLKEDIVKYADMKRKVKSLEDTEVSFRDTIATLQADIETLNLDIKEKKDKAKAALKTSETKAKDVLKDSEVKASDLISKASEEAKAISLRAYEEKKALEQEIIKLKETVDSLHTQVTAEENKLRKIKDEMARLKDSI